MGALPHHHDSKPTSRWRAFVRRVGPPVLVVAVILIVIQILADAEIIRSFILPPPSAVGRSLVRDTPAMAHHLLKTLKIAVWGYVLSTVIGVVFALLMDRFAWMYRAFYPLIVISQTIPTLVITPVIVLIFGYGDVPRLVVVVLVCFFPITISLYQGLKGVDSDLVRMMRAMGATRRDLLRHVKLPAALPSFFAGLRISSTYCVMAVVLAEWAGGNDGIGIYMLRTKRSFRFDAMFASIIWIVLLSLLFYAVSVALEWLGTPWLRADKTSQADA